MNTIRKNKLLIWFFVLLLLANIGTLIFFWIGRMKNNSSQDRQAIEFLIGQLKFDKVQQEKFEVLVAEHRSLSGKLRKEIGQSKEEMFSLLKSERITEIMMQAAVKKVSAKTESLDLITIDHFRKVRALCNTEQKKQFDGILDQLSRIMGNQRPPGGPMRNHDGPPRDRSVDHIPPPKP